MIGKKVIIRADRAGVFFVPSTASWEMDAAPYQHHNLRQFVNVTSLPFFSFNVPKNTPALSALIITFFPIIIL